MSAFAEMASNQMNCLNFTWDSPNNNNNKMMPVLDTMMWVGTEARVWDISPGIINDQSMFLVKTGDLKQIMLHNFYKNL